MLIGAYNIVYKELIQVLQPSQLIHDDLRLLAFGTDASFYRLIPKLVVLANTEQDIQRIVKICAANHVPITFQLPADYSRGFSTSRTCEIGLTENSGLSYTSIFYLVDEFTDPIDDE